VDEVLFPAQEWSKFFALHSSQGVTDRLTEPVRRRGLKMNVKKITKVMRISRQPYAVKKYDFKNY